MPNDLGIQVEVRGKQACHTFDMLIDDQINNVQSCRLQLRQRANYSTTLRYQLTVVDATLA